MGLDTAKAGGDKEHRKDRPYAYSTGVPRLCNGPTDRLVGMIRWSVLHPLAWE
jgi:hypothetical protein